MANARILSSSFTPVYNTNPDTGNLLVETIGSSSSGTVTTISNEVTLTSPSSVAVFDVLGSKDIMFQIKVESIDVNVIIIFEGTLNDLDWFNLSATEQSYTITANGTYAYTFYGVLKSARARFVSEANNTNAIIKVLLAKN